MRVVVIGGTRFVGRRIVEELTARGDTVLVVHRGVTEPPEPECEHLHVDRRDFIDAAEDIRAFRPDAVVDTAAWSRADVEAVLPYLPDVQTVVLSSMDVYRAYERFLSGGATVPVPLDESAELRLERYPHRDTEGFADYDKLDVEPAYLDRGGTALRLAMLYGERDPQCREDFVLRRVRAGRRRIPVGAGSWLWTRCYVGDVATAVLATLGNDAARGEVFNIGEPVTRTIGGWMERILAVAGHEAELVPVPEHDLPADLMLTRTFAQHLLFSSAKAGRLLGWKPSDPDESVARSVRWHMEQPAGDTVFDPIVDDQCLAGAALAAS